VNAEEVVEEAYQEFRNSKYGLGVYAGRQIEEEEAFKNECRMLVAKVNIEARIKFETVITEMKMPLTRQKMLTAINRIML
jgi:hypothetical protein